MQNPRLTKVILLWDLKFSELNPQCSTWSGEVREVFQNYGLGYFFDNLNLFPLKETIGTLRSRMKVRQRNELRVKCGNKPQLRNYVLFKNFDVTPPLLLKPLTFIQRKYLSKLTTSCLELRVCVVTRECMADMRVEYLFCPSGSSGWRVRRWVMIFTSYQTWRK